MPTRIFLLIAGLLLAAAARPDAAAAQQAVAQTAADRPSVVERLRPTPAAARLAPQADASILEANDEAELAQPVAPSSGVPYMIAGGALFLAGAVIGGDAGTIVMVGGAAIGAYGLFVHFN